MASNRDDETVLQMGAAAMSALTRLLTLRPEQGILLAFTMQVYAKPPAGTSSLSEDPARLTSDAEKAFAAMQEVAAAAGFYMNVRPPIYDLVKKRPVYQYTPLIFMRRKM